MQEDDGQEAADRAPDIAAQEDGGQEAADLAPDIAAQEDDGQEAAGPDPDIAAPAPPVAECQICLQPQGPDVRRGFVLECLHGYGCLRCSVHAVTQAAGSFCPPRQPCAPFAIKATKKIKIFKNFGEAGLKPPKSYFFKTAALCLARDLHSVVWK